MLQKIKTLLTSRPELYVFLCGLILGAAGGYFAHPDPDCVTEINGAPIVENPWKR